MIHLKRALPRLSAVALTFGGGCEGDDLPGTNPVERFCASLERCDPEGLVATYGSYTDCVRVVGVETDVLEYNFGQDCVDAYYAELDCGTRLGCNPSYETVQAVCGFEISETNALCR
ncbi:MAG: hypothetical protein AAGH15_04125 [Myxococcota bacterium]